MPFVYLSNFEAECICQLLHLCLRPVRSASELLVQVVELFFVLLLGSGMLNMVFEIIVIYSGSIDFEALVIN